MVNFIQTPLHNALTKYYKEQSVKQMQKKLSNLEEEGRGTAGHREGRWTDLPRARSAGRGECTSMAEVLRRLKPPIPSGFANVDVPPRDPDEACSRKDNLLRRIYIYAIAGRGCPHQGQDAQRPGGVRHLHQGFLAGGRDAGQPVDLLPIVALHRGRPLPARKELHPHLSALEPGVVPRGAGVAFFFVFEPVLDFLFSFNHWMGIDPDPRISEWLSFVMFLPLGFGVGFQLPLVMFFLERIGIFTVEGYFKQWRIAVLVILVIAAVLYPARPVQHVLACRPADVSCTSAASCSASSCRVARGWARRRKRPAISD